MHMPILNNKKEYWTKIVIYVITILAVVLQIPFFLADLKSIQIATIIFDLIIIILFVNAIVLYFKQNVHIASSVMLAIVSAGVLYSLYDGTSSEAHILWITLIPVILFFIKSKREAAVWSGIFTSCVVVILILQILNILVTPYSISALIQSILMLVLISSLSYFKD
jgi:hypothetical protein